MKELKKILIAFAGFIVCFMILDFGVGRFFDWAIKQMPSEGERVAKSEYVINKVKANFIVIGSSRAEAHYDSKVIKEAFPEYSVFNCGVDGQLFYYINTSFNAIMDRYTPKVVVWDFQLKDLVDDTPENLSLLYPYYYSNDCIRTLLDSQDNTLKLMLWNNCYRYNGTASRILRAMRMNESSKMGFSAHESGDKSRKIRGDDMFLKNQELIADKIALLSSTIRRAKKKGIKLVLCVSPMYVNLKGQSGTINYLRELAEQNNMIFIDDSQLDDFIRQEDYWYDGGHLNSFGAKKFTGILISQIKEKNIL